MVIFVGSIISGERASFFDSIREASTGVIFDEMLFASCQQEMRFNNNNNNNNNNNVSANFSHVYKRKKCL